MAREKLFTKLKKNDPVKKIKIMYVKAHDDDFYLGCSGIAQKHQRGLPVPYLGEDKAEAYTADQSVIVTFYGEKSKGINSGMTDEDIIKTRLLETKNASKIMNIKNEHLNYWERDYDNEEKRKEIRQTIRQKILSFEPDIIYTHSPKDKHEHHKFVNECVKSVGDDYSKKLVIRESAPIWGQDYDFMKLPKEYSDEAIKLGLTTVSELGNGVSKIVSTKPQQSLHHLGNAGSSVVDSAFGYIRNISDKALTAVQYAINIPFKSLTYVFHPKEDTMSEGGRYMIYVKDQMYKKIRALKEFKSQKEVLFWIALKNISKNNNFEEYTETVYEPVKNGKS